MNPDRSKKKRNSRKRCPRIPRRDRQSGHTNSDTHAPHDEERPHSRLDMRVNVEEIARRMQTTVATTSRIEEGIRGGNHGKRELHPFCQRNSLDRRKWMARQS